MAATVALPLSPATPRLTSPPSPTDPHRSSLAWTDLTPDGSVRMAITTPSTDPAPVLHGSTLKIHYDARIASTGKLFDSTRGGPPFQFIVGQATAIHALDFYALKCRSGERALIRAGSDHVHGVDGWEPYVPAGEEVEIDVEVVGVGEPPDPFSSLLFRATNLKDAANNTYKSSLSSSTPSPTSTLLHAISQYDTALSLIRVTWGASPIELHMARQLQTLLHLNLSQALLKLAAGGTGRVEVSIPDLPPQSTSTSTQGASQEPAKPAVDPDTDADADDSPPPDTTVDVHEAALAHAVAAHRADPDSIKAVYRAGLACVARGRWDEAEGWFKKALEIDPVDPAVKKEMQGVAEKRRKEKVREKEMYGRMFGGKV